MSKNRLEAFSDGMFAIILTILVLELHIPNLPDSSFAVFASAILGLAPKFLSFLFSFFIIAIFWVNHHHMVHLIERVDTKLLWLNIALLFFACLFPFLTAFVGDYPMNPYVVALYPLNMACSAAAMGALWKHAFVDSNLAPNKFTTAQQQKRVKQDRTAALINLGAAALAFIWVPITLVIIMLMPFVFVVPELMANPTEK